MSMDGWIFPDLLIAQISSFELKVFDKIFVEIRRPEILAPVV
jgi:hypothetical protein